MIKLPTNILNILENGEGFTYFQLAETELEQLRNIVRRSYEEVFHNISTSVKSELLQSPMTDYHLVNLDFDHAKVWQKKRRILPANDVEIIKESSLFSSLRSVLGNDIFISSEENSGWEEAYWRIVRPGTSDIGPVHADSWFWKLGHGSMPEGFSRLKVWIPLFNVAGVNGLQVLPFSHQNKDWSYKGVEKDNIIKPVINEDVSSLGMLTLPTANGQTVLFHDDLLHGGSENNTDSCRISLEFTVCYPN
jgi:hypothetical protein